jgi:hypothetical protein
MCFFSSLDYCNPIPFSEENNKKLSKFKRDSGDRSAIGPISTIDDDCVALYIKCRPKIYDDDYDLANDIFEYDNNEKSSFMMMEDMHLLPWFGKIYINGMYKCSGVLVHESWILVENKCREAVKYE